MKAKIKLAATMGAVVALVGIAGGPAFAADQGQAVVGSQAYWKSSTKVLTATDTAADGKSAVARLRTSSGKVYEVVNGGGKDTTKPLTISGIASGSTVAIQACTIDQSASGNYSCPTPYKSFKA